MMLIRRENVMETTITLLRTDKDDRETKMLSANTVTCELEALLHACP